MKRQRKNSKTSDFLNLPANSSSSHDRKDNNSVGDDDHFEKDYEKILKKQRKQELEEKEANIVVKPLNYFGDDEVQLAYEYVRRLCQQSCLVKERQLPPVVWRHQLYSLFSNRSVVDLELEDMVQRNRIRILCHGESTTQNDYIVLIDDFEQYYKRKDSTKNLFVDLFIKRVVRKYPRSVYTEQQLRDNGFGPDSIKNLISLGLLTKNDHSGRQLSFSGMGTFVRSLKDGRDLLMKIIRKSKYSQLLQSEMIRRYNKLKQVQGLGLEFHLYDLYGRDELVKRRSANIDGDYLIQAILK